MKTSTKIQIAILEDDQGIRDLLIMFFEYENYQVFAFESKKAFYEGIKGHRVDVFLLDVMVPDGNGMEVCKKLKSMGETADIPIIMMSAHADMNRMKYMCPANDFIAKPFDIDVLNEKIKKKIAVKNP